MPGWSRGTPGTNFKGFLLESLAKTDGFDNIDASGTAEKCITKSSSLKGVGPKNPCLFGASNFEASGTLGGSPLAVGVLPALRVLGRVLS